MKLPSYPAHAAHGASLPALPSALARLCALVVASAPAAAQFGSEHVISTEVGVVQGLFAADLDGDGDDDVLSASWPWTDPPMDDKIAWYENLGGGAFGPQQVISTEVNQVEGVFAADLDGDGDADVLSASVNVD